MGTIDIFLQVHKTTMSVSIFALLGAVVMQVDAKVLLLKVGAGKMLQDTTFGHADAPGGLLHEDN